MNRFSFFFAILLVLLSGCVTGDRLSGLGKQLNNPSLDCSIVSNQKKDSIQSIGLLYANSGLAEAKQVQVTVTKGNVVQTAFAESIPKNDSKSFEFYFSGDKNFLDFPVEWTTDWIGNKNNCDQTIP